MQAAETSVAQTAQEALEKLVKAGEATQKALVDLAILVSNDWSSSTYNWDRPHGPSMVRALEIITAEAKQKGLI